MVAAGTEKGLATETGIIWRNTADQSGRPGPVRLSEIIVPGLGHNLLPSVIVTKWEVSSTFDTRTPHVQF